MGERVAHSFAVRQVVDYLDVAPRVGIVKVRPPDAWVGRSLKDLDFNGRLQLTPVALRRGDGVTINPHPTEVIRADDELILIGRDDRLDELGG
jgi:trk system potassium uptake protein TrkA